MTFAAGRLAATALVRSPARTAGRMLVLGAAVALLGSMLLFVGHSLRTMTRSAIDGVPLDWQGPVSSATQARELAPAIAREHGIAQATPGATAPFAAASHSGPGGTTSAGTGAILAVAPGYSDRIRTFRLLHGSLRPGAVVLDQQLAATLQASVGSYVSILPRTGASPRRLLVSGVALITSPDVVFAPLNPLLGPAPAQPPANAAIMEFATFATQIAPELPAITGGASGASVVPGAQQGVQWQVDVQVRPRELGGTPAQALTRAGQVVNRVQRDLASQVRFVDNLSEQLNTAATDALYAQTLFIMLAVPGAIVALGLAYLTALGTVERDRRDLALLRARGATRGALVTNALTESAALGLVGGILGACAAFGAVSLVVGSGLGLTPSRALITILACVALAFAGAATARLAATRSVWGRGVSQARGAVIREAKPLWQRLGLDLFALAGSGLVYWLTASTGFSAIVNPDSNPTLSLSVYMFLAPALLWIGATLLAVRLRARALAWLLRRAAGQRAQTPGRFVLASAARRGGAINRGLLVMGLLLAFGVNLAIFTATYDQQANVDAELTLGADVTATAPPGIIASHALERKIAKVRGVQATTAVDHSYAYIGPDLQDTFGVDAHTIARATSLRDSYFLGGGVQRTLARLATRPDGILVSKETIADYQLQIGDLLNLRVLDHRDGRFVVVPFHVAGIVQEFPSAPRDSFMVANLSYLQSADHAGGPNLVFAKAANPASAARAVAAATRADGTSVASIAEQIKQSTSSITAVDLRGIGEIEEAFTLVLGAAAMALFVSLALIERRHEFATMAALGATLRSMGAFVWSEAALVLAAGLALAAVLGVLLAGMLVAMLQHVFDPPPDHMAIPWAYLGELAAAAASATALAAALAGRRLRRLPLGELLRER